MLSGQRPWHGLNLTQLAMHVGVEKQAPPVPANLPRTLQNMLAACFSPDPVERPGAAQLVQQLQQIISQQLSTLGDESALPPVVLGPKVRTTSTMATHWIGGRTAMCHRHLPAQAVQIHNMSAGCD